MELALNLAWLLLAAAMLELWAVVSARAGRRTALQLAALAVVLVILFPVISVTDDLQAAQCAAETECCARRDHAGCAHHAAPALAVLPAPSFCSLARRPESSKAIAASAAHFPCPPLLPAHQNRPPPAA
ncbi:MAG: hypothetical protein WCE75_04990 [Terracidiphilus sp.]